MKLFKFIGVRYALEALAFRRLKVSKPLETNDPFEMCPFHFTSDQSRDLFRRVMKSHTRNRGFVSFSGNCESPSMWANYSDNHQGICLGFEAIEKSLFTSRPQNFLTKIDYVKEFRPFNSAALTGDNTKLIKEEIDYAMRTKSSHWAYEEEYRAFTGDTDSDASSSITFLPFGSTMVLKEIILGHQSRIAPSDILYLTEAFEVQLFKAAPSKQKFAMERIPLERH